MTGNRTGLADGRYTAVIDRFEQTDRDSGRESDRDAGRESDRDSECESDRGGEVAVLLLESDEEVVAERIVPTWRLPEGARQQDAVLEVAVANGFVVSTTFDPEVTEARQSLAQSRFDKLAERPDEGSADANDDA